MLTTVAGCVMHPVQPLLEDMYMKTKRCVYCANQYPVGRYQLGYVTCLDCGSKDANAVKHTVVPLHKSNYIVVTNRDDLVGINVKGGVVK